MLLSKQFYFFTATGLIFSIKINKQLYETVKSLYLCSASCRKGILRVLRSAALPLHFPFLAFLPLPARLREYLVVTVSNRFSEFRCSRYSHRTYTSTDEKIPRSIVIFSDDLENGCRQIASSAARLLGLQSPMKLNICLRKKTFKKFHQKYGKLS